MQQYGRQMQKLFPAAVPVSEKLEVLSPLMQGFGMRTYRPLVPSVAPWLFSEATAAGKASASGWILPPLKLLLNGFQQQIVSGISK